MNHIGFPSLCLAAVIAASPYLAVAQEAPPAETDVAIRTAVLRQAKLVEVRGFIGQGRTAEAERDTIAAAQAYNRALQGLREIGGVVEPERSDAVAGLSRTTLALADQAMRRGDYIGARTHLTRVLNEDPKNQEALELRARNERLIIDTADKTPHDIALETVRNSETNRIEVAKLVQDGKLYYETGRMKEAEKALRDAIRLDPGNKAAAYYLDLVNGRRYLEEIRLREVNSKQMVLEIERQWSDPVKREALPVPNPYAHTNVVRSSPAREKIYQKLRTIRLNELIYDGLPLSEVIKNVSDEALKRDLEKKGVNILIAANADSATAVAPLGVPGAPGALPAAGLPPADPGLPLPGPEAVDLNGVTIRITTPLRDVTLEEALNVITMVADRKIKWSVEDFGIVISPRAPDAIPLHTRFFRVDPNTFWQGLANVTAFSFGESQGGGGGSSGRGGGGRSSRSGGGGRGGFGGGGQGGIDDGSGGGAIYAGVSIAPGGQQGRGGQQGVGLGGGVGAIRGGVAGAATAGGAGAGQFGGSGGIEYLTAVTPTATVIPAVKSFFATAGVNLEDPGKAVFFNDRLGYLMVRATLQDLDTIERAVQMLNMAPPQLTIRAKFMEVNQDDNRALGFDWLLGNTLVHGGAIGVQGGTAPSMTAPGASSPANPSGWFPGPGIAPGVPGPNAIPSAPTDAVVTGGLRNTAPALATVTGILTDPQFRFVVRALEQRGGSDLLACPEVTAQSGRQAQIKVVEVRYIVTDLDTDQTSAGGATTGVTGTTTGGGGIGSLIQPIAEPMELGPVLDVVPYVLADGYTIQLTLLPTLKEFLGYDDPGQFVAQVQSVGSAGSASTPLVAPLPLPKFRLRQVATTAMVWDGQTVVLGGLIAETVQKTKDKVPVLGDIPFVGRFFRSEANTANKKNLVIFVTPTIIDPAGNRMHAEEDMPFAQHSTPVQPPPVTVPPPVTQ